MLRYIGAIGVSLILLVAFAGADDTVEMNNRAFRLQYGLDVPVDVDQAERLYISAAALGDGTAMYNLSLLYIQRTIYRQRLIGWFRLSKLATV